MASASFVALTVVLLAVSLADTEAWSSRRKRSDAATEGSISIGLSVSANFTLTSDFNATCKFFERAHLLRQDAQLKVLQLTSDIIQACDANLTLNKNFSFVVNILRAQAEDVRYLAANCNTYWKEQRLLRILNELLQIIARIVQERQIAIEMLEGEALTKAQISLEMLQNLMKQSYEAFSAFKKSIEFHVEAVQEIVVQIKSYWNEEMGFLLEKEQKIILQSNTTLRDVDNTKDVGRIVRQRLIYAAKNIQITGAILKLFSNPNRIDEGFTIIEIEIRTLIAESLKKIEENAVDISFVAETMKSSIEEVLEKLRIDISSIRIIIYYQTISNKVSSELTTMHSSSSLNDGIIDGILNDSMKMRHILSQLDLDESEAKYMKNITPFGNFLSNIKRTETLKESILELKLAFQQRKTDEVIIQGVLKLNESDEARELAQKLSAFIQRQIANITTVLDKLKPFEESVRDKVHTMSTQLTASVRIMWEKLINFTRSQKQQCEGVLENNGIAEDDDFNDLWKRVLQDCVETGSEVDVRLKKIKEEIVSSERSLEGRIVNFIFSNLKIINENTTYFKFVIIKEFTYFVSDVQARIADMSSAAFVSTYMYQIFHENIVSLIQKFHLEIEGMMEEAKRLQIILIQVFQIVQQIQLAEFPSNSLNTIRSLCDSILLIIQNGSFRNLEMYQDLIVNVELVFSMLDKLRGFIGAIQGTLPSKTQQLCDEMENLQRNGSAALEALRNFIINGGNGIILSFSSSFQQLRAVLINHISLINQRNKAVFEELKEIASPMKDAFRNVETILIIANQAFSSELQNIVEISANYALEIQTKVIRLRIDSLRNYTILSRMEENLTSIAIKNIAKSFHSMSSFMIQISSNGPQNFTGLFTYLKEFQETVRLEISIVIFNIQQIINVFESQNITVMKDLSQRVAEAWHLIVEGRLEQLEVVVQQLLTHLKIVLPDIKSTIPKLQGEMQDKAKLSLAVIQKWIENGILDIQGRLRAWFLDFFTAPWKLLITFGNVLKQLAQTAIEEANEIADQSGETIQLLRVLAQRCITAVQTIIKYEQTMAEDVTNIAGEMVIGILNYILELIGTSSYTTEKLDEIITNDLVQRLRLTYLLKPVEYIMNSLFFFYRALQIQMQVITWRNIPETIYVILGNVLNEALQLKQALFQEFIQIFSQFSQVLNATKNLNIPVLGNIFNSINTEILAFKNSQFEQPQAIKTFLSSLEGIVSKISSLMQLIPGASKTAVQIVVNGLLSIIEDLTRVLNATGEFRNIIQQLVSNSRSIISQVFFSIEIVIRDTLQYVNIFIELIKSILVFIASSDLQIDAEAALEVRNSLQLQIGVIDSALARVTEMSANFNTSLTTFVETIFEELVVETLVNLKLNISASEMSEKLGEVIEEGCERFVKGHQDMVGELLSAVTNTCEIVLSHFLVSFRLEITTSHGIGTPTPQTAS